MTIKDKKSEKRDVAVEKLTPLTPEQVPNSAGGYVWEADRRSRLRRFLCLGTEGGTYYIGERDLAKENAKSLMKMIDEGDGCIAVEDIVSLSVEGRVAKQQPLLFSLALCARSSEIKTKQAAYEAVQLVCRIPTHLFFFVELCEKMSAGTGWGRAMRRAISRWYTNRPAEKLAFAVTKYKCREGWTHKDVLRLSHVKTKEDDTNAVLKYCAKGYIKMMKYYENIELKESTQKVLDYLTIIEDVKNSNDEQFVCEKIEKFNLVREHIPTKMLKSKEIQRSLLFNMPMTALIRNLGRLTDLGLISQDGPHEQLVVDNLTNEKMLKYAKIHPFNILVAVKTYEQGKGDKGKLEWNPNKNITQALYKSFYAAFETIPSTGKRFLIALDVSGSMDFGYCLGNRNISPRLSSVAMAMTLIRSEKDCTVMGFSDQYRPLDITKFTSLKDAVRQTKRVPQGPTDCALPMTYAETKGQIYDCFVIFTDNETCHGKIHPVQALRSYRSTVNPEAKLVVIAMTSNGFTIADPDDRGMLDIAGFDSAAPSMITNFAIGLI